MLTLRVVIATCVATLTACGDHDTFGTSTGFTAVEVDPGAPAALQLAVQACVGLHNRKRGGSAYLLKDADDRQWLTDLNLKPDQVVNAPGFLKTCTTEFPACVRYDYREQQRLLPNILTVASSLDAVPLDVGMDPTCNHAVFDATVEFAELNTPDLATRYVFERYVGQTTGLAMLNPGYETSPTIPARPNLTRDMSSALVDFVFSQKLFVVFLVNGCSSNPERQLLSDIVNSGQWPTPLGVYGYNNSWNIGGGYLYEAQTRCLPSRNMGAIASETDNLSFFSTRRAPILSASELQRNAPEEVTYDPSKTYVAFVVGDGDNLDFIMSTRRAWLRQRLADCAGSGRSCEPITWTISSHLTRLAPDVLAWYYQSTRRTGRDYFTLPPSGHLYAYPTSLREEDQDRFVTLTEQDARTLGVQGTVHWDWFGTWERAEQHFLPKYARVDGVIRGIFPVNVPYAIPIFTWWPADQFFELLEGQDGGRLALFLPREWRGVDDSSAEFFPSPRRMAEQIESYPPGTITWVYMTSDGGLSLENSFDELVPLLPSRVQLVSTDTAAKLALERGGPLRPFEGVPLPQGEAR